MSIIVNNYNYGRYLAAAIESALDQTYCNTEVIVVDDGSTDNSRDIITGFEGRIAPIFKENGGQASAFNAGFARAKGDIVIFLDADDVLLPDIVARVVAKFQSDAQLGQVQYRLEIVDEHRVPTGNYSPPVYLEMPQGDLRRRVLTFPDDIPYPPTSGHAYAAWVLRAVFPVPEQVYGAVGADLYLYNVTPLFAPIASLPGIGGYYRTHSANLHHTNVLNLTQIRHIIVRSYDTHRFISHFAYKLGLYGFPKDPAAVRSVTFVAHRLTSLRLEPQLHPIADDRVGGLLQLGILAALGRTDLRLFIRFGYILWFIAVALGPRPLVRWLVKLFFFPETRPRLGSLLEVAQAGRPARNYEAEVALLHHRRLP